MNGISPKPAIFTDKSIKYASRYVLSTSNISMKQSPLFGGFSPMVRCCCFSWSGFEIDAWWGGQYEDGYGVCYGLNEESLKFAITSYAVRAKVGHAYLQQLTDMSDSRARTPVPPRCVKRSSTRSSTCSESA